MTLPLFAAGDDPGPSFVGLLAHAGHGPRSLPPSAGGRLTNVPHGTTVLAVRCADGVVMAADRRGTSGNLIVNRTMEKLRPADRFSGVAFAGAAGPGIQMLELFQLQLEHYEKIEGRTLSLEGKANQLSQMVRDHMPAARQGLAVVPLFAGFDLGRQAGRLFEYDVTGGRYEESEVAATGSGSLHAATVIKLGFHDRLTTDDAVDLSIDALFQAADEDTATGGPDLVRGIFPVVATITADGFARLDDADVRDRFQTLVQRLTARTAR